MTRSKQIPCRLEGFGLVVSLSMLALLVLIMLSLSTLLQVELAMATHEKDKSKAQQNALLGMQIALSQLQTYAGPDQRVTARSDLEYGAVAPNRFWTGVYGSAIEPDYNKDPVTIATEWTDPANINEKGSSARLLNWLVSGNEQTAFSSTENIGSKGNVIAEVDEDSISFRPDAEVAGLVDGMSATSADVKIGGRDARILVGSGSVANKDDFVLAPLVEINEPLERGGYAWWVGDEGVKASANMAIEQEEEDKIYAFTNANRTAIELMADGEDENEDLILKTTTINERYNAKDERLENVFFPSALAVLSTDAEEWQNIMEHRFHDISAGTSSVIADVYAGGVKRDLSILLHESYSANSSDPAADSAYLWEAHPEDPNLESKAGYGIPTWKHLRSFYQTRVPTSGTDQLAMDPVLPAYDKDDDGSESFIDHVGIAPVITYFSLGFRVVAEGNTVGTPLQMRLFPLVVIWNPYNFTIKAHEYEAGIYGTYSTELKIQVLKPLEGDLATDYPNIGYVWQNRGNATITQDADGHHGTKEYLRFLLNCPDIPPGQSLIFSLSPGSNDEYDQKNVLENIEPEPDAYVYFNLIENDNTEVRILEGEENYDYRVVNSVRQQLSWDGKDSYYNFGASFSNGGGGLGYMYLGEPVDDTRLRYGGSTRQQSDDFQNPAWEERRWYNVHEGAGWDKIPVDTQEGTNTVVYSSISGKDEVLDPKLSIIQEAGPIDNLLEPEPAFVMTMRAMFSGDGSNGKFNSNQHMFPVRWIAQENIRAPRTSRTRRDRNFNPLFMANAGQFEGTVTVPWHGFNSADGPNGHRASAGSGHDWVNGEPVDATLFEFPYEGIRLQSIGQLQHANLSLFGAYPSYPVGNSLADFRLHSKSGKNFPAEPAGYQLARVDYVGTGPEFRNDHIGYYDVSYLLNRTLWDQYYFSTLDPEDASWDDIENERQTVVDVSIDPENPDENAAGMMVKGGFNINSTSEQAWRAVLGGNRHLEFDPENPSATGSEMDASFPRFLRPTADNDPNDPWQGYRTLSDEQIAQLARNIVEEVRARGPFTSMSDFVNRRLVDNPDTAEVTTTDESYGDEHLKGPLQAAIDRTLTTEDTETETGRFAINNYDPSEATNFWSKDALIDVDFPLQDEQFYGQQEYVYDREQVYGSSTNPVSPVGSLSAFAPKYVTQADVLATIGASLTARSDTFVIRSYGEVVDPYNPENRVSQAWCEAVVQRTPEYMDESESAYEDPVNSENKHYNRKFKIISFRWLSPDEV